MTGSSCRSREAHSGMRGAANATNAEFEIRNAECIGERRTADDVPVKLRIPHSAFRVAGVALSVLAILIATLRPTGDFVATGWSFSLASGDKATAEVIENLLLFIPFGIALALRSPSPEEHALSAAQGRGGHG